LCSSSYTLTPCVEVDVLAGAAGCWWRYVCLGHGYDVAIVAYGNDVVLRRLLRVALGIEPFTPPFKLRLSVYPLAECCRAALRAYGGVGVGDCYGVHGVEVGGCVCEYMREWDS